MSERPGLLLPNRPYDGNGRELYSTEFTNLLLPPTNRYAYDQSAGERFLTDPYTYRRSITKRGPKLRGHEIRDLSNTREGFVKNYLNQSLIASDMYTRAIEVTNMDVNGMYPSNYNNANIQYDGLTDNITIIDDENAATGFGNYQFDGEYFATLPPNKSTMRIIEDSGIPNNNINSYWNSNELRRINQKNVNIIQEIQPETQFADEMPCGNAINFTDTRNMTLNPKDKFIYNEGVVKFHDDVDTEYLYPYYNTVVQPIQNEAMNKQFAKINVRGDRARNIHTYPAITSDNVNHDTIYFDHYIGNLNLPTAKPAPADEGK